MAWQSLLTEAVACLNDGSFFHGVQKINLCMEEFEKSVSDIPEGSILANPKAFSEAMLASLSEDQKAALAHMHEVRGDILLGLGATKRALEEFTCASAIVEDGTAAQKKHKVEDSFRESVLVHKVPCTIIAGPLGSGKTTLVNHILQSQPCHRVAVIKNKFGDTGIEDKLSQDTLVLETEEDVCDMCNGCTCTIRRDLVQGIRKLIKKSRVVGKELDRIVIETTSLAALAPVAQTFLNVNFIGKLCSLDGILVVVDAYQILQHICEGRTLGDLNETAKQLAMADRIILNKIELMNEETSTEVEKRIRTINPFVPIERVSQCLIDMDSILGIDAWSADQISQVEPGFLDHELGPAHKVISCHLKDGEVTCLNMVGKEIFTICVPAGEEPFGSWLRRAAKKHTGKRCGLLHLVQSNGDDIWVEPGPQEQVNSVGIEIPGEVQEGQFDQWLTRLLQEKNIDLFRFKGVLALSGRNEPFVFHGMHMHFWGLPHSQRMWQENEQRRCKINFIGRNLNKKELVDSFRQCMAK